MNVTDLAQAFEALECASNTAALGRVVAKYARGMGFERFAYVMNWGGDPHRRLLLSDYPTAWVERYVERGYFAIDPTLRHTQFSRLPCIWDEHIDGARKTAEFWDEARSFGLSDGLTLAAKTADDASHPAGLLSLCRDRALDMKGVDMARLLGGAQLFARLVHQTVCRLQQRSADMNLARAVRPNEIRGGTFDDRALHDADEIFGGISHSFG